MNYSAHWTATIFAAIVLHFLAALGFSYILPHLTPEPKISAVIDEFEWVDADFSAAEVVAEEKIPSETPQETFSPFNAQDLFISEPEIPELQIEPIKTIETPEIKPVERPKPQIKPEPEIPKPPAQIQPTEPPPEVISENQQLGKPPVTVKEVYPEKNSGLGYKGYVVIAVTVGKDGKIQAANVVSSSGRYFVDEIALKAARQWIFRPALDKIGRPMTCDKIITFDFKKF